MEVVGEVASMLSCLCSQNCANESIGRQWARVRRQKRNLDKLRRRMDELNAQAEELKTKLEQERMQTRQEIEPKPGVKLWLTNVEEIDREVNRITDRNTRERLSRCHPKYLCSQIEFGRLVEEKMEDAVELLKKGNFSGQALFAEKLLKKGQILPTAKLMDNPTTIRNMMKIWDYLTQPAVGRIGVYGMGGVGKTTIMREIHNRLLKESSCFDCVIWVTVPKDSNLDSLQMAIADRLNLDLSKCKLQFERSAVVFEALSQKERFVLILDDLWEPFSLETVGIPNPTAENGCKLVLTTRLVTTCRGMETDEELELKVFSGDEAWNLFSNKVGERILLNPDIERIAREVAKECGGLPLAIVTVALALRKASDISEWENALTELRSSIANLKGMEERVYARLRFSFTNLRDDVTRSCLLYCALYPEGHQIDVDQLIEYWMWEGFLGDSGWISDKKHKGKIILNELKNACLLESIHQYGIECVRMHDLIRDMAISITKVSPCCIVRAGIGLKKPPRIDEWVTEVQRVSLMRNDLKGIPFNPRCPMITSLLLQYNSLYENLPRSFFVYMQSLIVIDLSYTGIEFLPESLSNLENLSALLLSNCWNLKLVPSLSKLVKLKVLDLSWCCGMKQVPHGIDQLCNLRRLNLTQTSISVFPTGLLATATLLEDLLVIGCDFLWVSKAMDGNRGGAYIEEIISSTSLSSLEVEFWSLEFFNEYVRSGHWNQLDNFKFSIGASLQQCSEKRSVVIKEYGVSPYSMVGRPTLLPTNTSELHLVCCNNIVTLTTCLQDMVELKSCCVYDCFGMQSITNPKENGLCTLEKIRLDGLYNLRVICDGVTEQDSLKNLKIIEVVNCNRLKCLFLGNMLDHLQNLEEISISDCANLEHVMREEEEQIRDEICSSSSRSINLPRLRSLKLYFLPKLKTIYEGTVVSDFLKFIEILWCNSLKKLPLALPVDGNSHQLSPPPALEEIKGTIRWWESLEWEQPDAKAILQPYFLNQKAIMYEHRIQLLTRPVMARREQ